MVSGLKDYIHVKEHAIQPHGRQFCIQVNSIELFKVFVLYTFLFNYMCGHTFYFRFSFIIIPQIWKTVFSVIIILQAKSLKKIKISYKTYCIFSSMMFCFLGRRIPEHLCARRNWVGRIRFTIRRRRYLLLVLKRWWKWNKWYICIWFIYIS